MTQHASGMPCSTLAQLIVHGVFDRLPELRFYFAEINAALFAAQMYYMDRDYLEYNSWFELDLPKLPSEYVLEHGLYGIVREPLAVEMGREMPDRMPLDHFWWGSDFPHSLGTFPRVSRVHQRDDFVLPQGRQGNVVPLRGWRTLPTKSLVRPLSRILLRVSQVARSPLRHWVVAGHFRDYRPGTVADEVLWWTPSGTQELWWTLPSSVSVPVHSRVLKGSDGIFARHHVPAVTPGSV
jgi:hypothetical protein